MCSLTLNKTSDEQLDSLKGERKKIEKKIVRRAWDANVNNAGLLDAPNTHLRNFSGDLQQVRKETIGRHRVYYIGRHTDCRYDVIYIKLNKKGDNWQHDDDNEQFRDKLRRSLEADLEKIHRNPKEEENKA